MQRFLLYLSAQIKLIWQQLDFSQRLTTILLSLILVLGLTALAFWGARPDYSVLFSNLNPADAGKVVGKLNENKVPYQLGGNGSVISVPKDRVGELRLMLANEGIPSAEGGGFELFDNFKFGMTDFSQKLNFQRALQTELARTISKISSVKNCRVHIAFPDDELYTEYKQPTTASVILDLNGTAELTSGQIKGIVNLVSAAVKGLSAQNVTIVDTEGNMLYHKDPEIEGMGNSGEQFDEQGKFERMMENRIQSMLYKILGPNKAVVRVAAQLDFEMAKTESEIYEPSETPIPRSTKTSEESYTGEGDGARSPMGGAPPAGARSNYSKTEETNNFEVTKHIKKTIKSPGQIKKLSVAIVLDRAIQKEDMANIQAAASAAAGIDPARGDVIVVKTMAFDKTLLEDSKKEMKQAETMALIQQIVQYAAIGIGILIFFLFVRSILKKASKFQLPLVSYDIGGEEYGSPAHPRPTAEMGTEERLQVMATQQTDEFISRLRSWLGD